MYPFVELQMLIAELQFPIVRLQLGFADMI